MNKKKRIMIIGLDGATFNLIKQWIKEEKLPTFKKLLDNGVHGDLLSTIPHATIPAWPSFATGCNPGKHGFYDFFKEKSGSYDLTVEMRPSKAIKELTIWEILSDYGSKVGVINVPGTYPPIKVNGFIVSGMLTPPKVNFTYPPDFEKELIENIGEYKVFFSSLSAKNPEVLLEDLKKTLEMRAKALEYIWLTKKVDFLMMVDNGTDRAEHVWWKYLDQENPLYKKSDVEEYGNPLLEYYQEVDGVLSRIMNMIDEDTVLILMSDHGQGPLRKFVNLNMFLIKEGHMVVKKSTISKIKYFLFKFGFSPKNIYDILGKIGIERYASDRINQKTKLSIINKIFFSTSDIDWSKTKAFSSGVTGAITINLKNREPEGCVSFDEEYERIKDEIIKKLNLLIDPENKKNIVKKVYKKEEIYFGPYLDKAPDIVAVPTESYEFFGMHGFTFNKIIIPTFGNSGGHRSEGIFIAFGNKIKKGIEIKGAKIIDIVPTVLNIMNIPTPENIDGNVLNDIFENNKKILMKHEKHRVNNSNEKGKIGQAISKLSGRLI